jgi:hypothetical protein
MPTCPLCNGTGIDAGSQSIGSGKTLREGDFLMVRETPDWTYRRATVTHFKPSGVKLRNDGDYTVLIEGEAEPTFFQNGDGHLFQCCLFCEGRKEVSAAPAAWQRIRQSETSFLLSGGGTFRAAEQWPNTWVKLRYPLLRGTSDLLTIGVTVYQLTEYPKFSEDDVYQTFTIKEVGTTDVTDHVPTNCETHGWFFPEEGPTCPECPSE